MSQKRKPYFSEPLEITPAVLSDWLFLNCEGCTRTAAEAPRCQIRAALEAACLEHVPLPEDVKRRVGWTPGSRAARPCPDRTPPHERWVL